MNVARVVRASGSELRLVDRLGRRDVQPVAERRVDAERSSARAAGCRSPPRRAAAPRAPASPSRSSTRSSARRTASGSSSARSARLSFAQFARNASSCCGDELRRGRARGEVVGRREEEALERIARFGRSRADGAGRRSRRGTSARFSRTRLPRLRSAICATALDARRHLLAREALGEDDPERLRRRDRRSASAASCVRRRRRSRPRTRRSRSPRRARRARPAAGARRPTAASAAAAAAAAASLPARRSTTRGSSTADGRRRARLGRVVATPTLAARPVVKRSS